ncbi:hypothetical protein MMC25_002595 [Agyrium rufum]|nr:hypothetical protein [Agyrium rufum]
MSLNGLDESAIREAHTTALSKAGGWFLMKYATRDTVEIYKNGGNGVVEARQAIAEYDEQSPLFGVLQFRRKKVLLKYVPGGTSRLLQARLVVHFQAVEERFPHDSIVSFAIPSDLSESAVSSTLAPSTSSASIKSSSSSLRGQPLEEIREDAGESEKAPTTTDGGSTVKGYNPESTPDATPPPLRRNASITSVRIANPAMNGSSPTKSRGRTENTMPTPPDEDGALPERTMTWDLGTEKSIASRPSFERRASSQSTRPSVRDLQESYGYRGKIKLGPRPSLDLTDHSGRPRLQSRRTDPRQIASLPSGVRIPTRDSMTSRPTLANRAATNGSIQTFGTYHPEKFVAEVYELPDRPPSAGGSIRSVATTSMLMDHPKQHTAPTPEKLRLMKALQIRQKRLATRPLSVHSPDHVSSASSTAPEVGRTEDVGPTKDSSAIEVPATVDSAVDPTQEGEVDDSSQSNSHVSPASIPDSSETSEPPSTQASSVTDNEEAFLRKPQDIPEEKVEHPPTDVPGSSAHPSENQSEVAPAVRESTQDLSSPDTAQDTFQAQSSEVTTTPVTVPAQIPNDGNQSEGVIPSIQTTDFALKTPSTTNAEEPSVAARKASVHFPEDLAVNIPTDGHSVSADQHLDTSGSPIHLAGSSPKDVNTVQKNSRNTIPDPSQHTTSTARLSTESSADSESPAAPQRKRNPTAPIRIITPGEVSDENYTSDDTFMEELQSATVQEATPMTVSRSPITSVFPRSPRSARSTDRRSSTEASRTVTNTQKDSPSSQRHLSPDLFDTGAFRMRGQQARDISPGNRSVSSPFEIIRQQDPSPNSSPTMAELTQTRSMSVSPGPRPESTSPTPQPKKIGVSSGISQRIKALEKFSKNNEASGGNVPNVTPAFVSKRKVSLPQPAMAKPPVSTPPATTGWAGFRRKIPYPTPSPSPEVARTIASKVAPAERETKAAPKKEPTEPVTEATPPTETISVTARIIRDVPNEKPEIPLNPSEPVPLHLHHSPLVVEHQTSKPAEPNPQTLSPPAEKQVKAQRPGSSRSITSTPSMTDNNSKENNKRNSSGNKRDNTTSNPRDSFTSRRSTSSRKGSDVESSRPLSQASSSEGADGQPKKESRTTRLFKRMSTMSSASRRSIAQALSPTPQEEAGSAEGEYFPPDTVVEEEPASVDIGDINVQFPDTLLWKRRHMEIDGKGYLVLSRAKADDHSKITPKKHHLSEFRSPYVPDLDMQELPNSVILDYKNGSTLQLGCENPVAQARVLKEQSQEGLLNLEKHREQLTFLANPSKATPELDSHRCYNKQPKPIQPLLNQKLARKAVDCPLSTIATISAMTALLSSPVNLPVRSTSEITQPMKLQMPPRSLPPSMTTPPTMSGIRSGHLNLDVFSPVNQNGSFEFDRVIKSGELYKRSRKTKQWKKFHLVLRPNLLSIYKNASEEKLHKQISLSELDAVATLKDPKQRRAHLFGLFSPSRNYHFQAPSEKEMRSWVDLIKAEARIDEEEQEVIGKGALTRRESRATHRTSATAQAVASMQERLARERFASSSPEPMDFGSRGTTRDGVRIPGAGAGTMGIMSGTDLDYSGNDMAGSYSEDFSDSFPAHYLAGRSSASLTGPPPILSPMQHKTSKMDHSPRARHHALSVTSAPRPDVSQELSIQTHTPPTTGINTITSSTSAPPVVSPVLSNERVMMHGYLLYLKTQNGIRAWKRLWLVLRPKNLAFYKNEEEYAARLIIPLSNIISAVEIDPVSRTKRHCLQIIAEDRTYRFCAEGEEILARWLGALKSLIVRRKAEMGGSGQGKGNGSGKGKERENGNEKTVGEMEGMGKGKTKTKTKTKVGFGEVGEI